MIQGDLSSTISVVGQLAAEQSSSLAFAHMSGTANLLTLGVQAGNTVTATQVLATIDAASYQQALDQAKSDLQAAEETLADLKAPATALEIAQADAATATAEKTLEQAKSDLADLSAPDLTSLENAVKDAEDTLKLLQIQSDLAERDSLAKSEHDIRYNVNWYGRRIASLEAMTKRNAEQPRRSRRIRGFWPQPRPTWTASLPNESWRARPGRMSWPRTKWRSRMRRKRWQRRRPAATSSRWRRHSSRCTRLKSACGRHRKRGRSWTQAPMRPSSRPRRRPWTRSGWR